MKQMVRILILFIVGIANVQMCHADWFKGRVVNAETGEPLVGASINTEVKPQPEWSMQDATEADSTGCFIIESPWEGRILFTFSLIGYKNCRKVDYSYGSDVSDTIDVGTIRLQPTALMLREVEVRASLPRVTMSGDTIVFNPEAFKLKEGARLDELIKKLPGVESRDGQLFWNNKPIRLMVNGKNLFGGDQIIQELPAEVADKIKLYDRKSELARHTGADDGTEDQVLDIKVKPGFLDKWYGRVDADYQTTKRYMFDLLAHRLSDHDPHLLYIQANNRNRYVDRDMRMSMNRDIDSDGKSQYGAYFYQHNWQTLGTNTLSGNTFDIGANLGHSDGWATTEQTSETFFPNQDHTLSLSKNYHYDHKLNPQLQASLFAYTDSTNLLDVSLGASYEKRRSNNEDNGASYSYEPDQFRYYSLAEAMGAKPGDALYEHLVTRNHNYRTTESQSRSLSLNYTWTHFWGQKGSFSLSGNTSASGTNEDQYVTRRLEYVREGRNENQWQRFDRDDHDIQTNLGATFNYWLTPKAYLSVIDRVTYQRYHQSNGVFADTEEELAPNGAATTPDAANGMNTTGHSWTNQLSLKSTFTPVKQWMIMPQFDWTATRESADYHYGSLDTTAVRNSQTYTPSLFLKWKPSRVRSLDLSFAYATTVPSLTSTFAYRNTTDPLSISMGNTSLSNSHSHTTTFGYHRMWLRQQIVLGMNASYKKDIHPLATLFRYHAQTGVYETKPMNVKGGDAWQFGVNYDQGLGVDFRVMNNVSLTSSRSYGFLTIVDDDAIDCAPTLNQQRLLGVSNNLELSYEVNKLQLKLYDRLTWNRYRYDVSSYNNHTLSNIVGASLNLDIRSFSIYFDIKDYYQSGYQTSYMNGHSILAEGEVSYRFCKNKCELSLSADDIFNQDAVYEGSYSAYQRSETASDYLHHYLKLSFSYRFDAKGQKQ